MFNNIRRKIGIRLGKMRIGDTVEAALSKVGITDEKVQKWLGKPCGCKERKDKWNQIGLWAQRVIAGDVTEEQAKEHIAHLERMTELPPE